MNGPVAGSVLTQMQQQPMQIPRRPSATAIMQLQLIKPETMPSATSTPIMDSMQRQGSSSSQHGSPGYLSSFAQPESRTGRHRKLTSRVGEMIKEATQRQEHRDGHVSHIASFSSEDEASDPNEPRYCICNQVSYGDMVACDNKDCPFEWFHYACVGVTQPPKGKWYCPQCTKRMRRENSRVGNDGDPSQNPIDIS